MIAWKDPSPVSDEDWYERITSVLEWEAELLP